MEEFNFKSPSLVTAITGHRKKLLSRVKRLLAPAYLQRGYSRISIAFVFMLGIIFIFSLNAFTVIPGSFDLKGRESGENVYNILPFNPENFKEAGSTTVDPVQSVSQTAISEEPDTIISKSKSGKVVMHLYTDSTGTHDEEELQLFVETIDDIFGDKEMDQEIKELEREVIILKSEAGKIDSLRKIVVIKNRDSIQVIKDDTVMFFPYNFDTSFTTSGGFEFYGFEMPEIPELPELPALPELPEYRSFYYFDDGNLKEKYEFERSLRDFERDIQARERGQQMRERAMKEAHAYRNPPPAPMRHFRWEPQESGSEKMNAERIIRQELRDDVLTVPGKKYIIEVDSKAMYINGEKQSKEIYRKYKKLLESLEHITFDGDDVYKLMF